MAALNAKLKIAPLQHGKENVLSSIELHIYSTRRGGMPVFEIDENGAKLISQIEGKFQGMKGNYLLYQVLGYRGVSTMAQYMNEYSNLILIGVDNLGFFNVECLDGRYYRMFDPKDR